MARWRLMSAHYLNVPGTEWEYKETDRTTGKQGRKVFAVPLLLNPEDPSDHNYKAEGEIIVCHEGCGTSKDIVFIGPPTPEMEPLDDEAEAISAKESHKWIHPIESLPGQGYNQSLLNDLQTQVAALTANLPSKPAAPVATSGINAADFTALQEQVAALMARNAELEERLPARRA